VLRGRSIEQGKCDAMCVGRWGRGVEIAADAQKGYLGCYRAHICNIPGIPSGMLRYRPQNEGSRVSAPYCVLRERDS
jgi:hypothetical protein